MARMNSAGPVDTAATPYTTLHTLPFAAARITSGFWAKFQRTNREISLVHGYEMLEQAGNFHNLRMAAGLETGDFMGRNFYDEDVYKWLEALAWEMGREPSPVLQQMANETIALIEAAQQPDGYLNSYYQTAEPDQKWTDLDHGHELYCAGHLIQAAVAFQRVTSDKRLLAVACRFAEHIGQIFGPDKRLGTCGHPEIEMALVELYRTTGEKRYLDLAEFFLDQRGQRRMRGLGAYGPEYQQDHVPVREAQEAAGHAVRQMYLVAGATDLYMETGEEALFEAMSRLWRDIVFTKIHITGGLGARFDGEAFGDPYELPSDQCYCETCAAIGSFMWNWRLLLITGDSRYADLMERTLYNGILSSPGLDGQSYFYANPLLVRGGRYVRASTNPPEGAEYTGRPAWHGVACCPPNVMRLFSSLDHYLATVSNGGIQIHHFASGELVVENEDGRIAINMASEYPWDGRVAITINETPVREWELALRIPEWCAHYHAFVNDNTVDSDELVNGYLGMSRRWQRGDRIVLELDMTPQLIAPDPRIDAVRGSLAIQRGPIIYCLETQDQPAGTNLADVAIDSSAVPAPKWNEDLMGGIVTLRIHGQESRSSDWNHNPYRPVGTVQSSRRRPVALTAVPYYAWGNRGLASMRVWLPVAS